MLVIPKFFRSELAILKYFGFSMTIRYKALGFGPFGITVRSNIYKKLKKIIRIFIYNTSKIV
jgi:hypothetical protein